MTVGHYPALLGGYATALGGWMLLSRWSRSPWPAAAPARFARPWVETGWVLLAGVGVIGIGQLWVRGIHLPEVGPAGPILASINQVFIFAPIPLVLLLRRQGAETAWLGTRHLARRLGLGIVLAIAAVTVYSLLRSATGGPIGMLGRIARYEHLDAAVQVFLEDVAIAVLLVRLAAALGTRAAVVLVAMLFAAAHIPALLAGGATPGELSSLVLDAALGAFALSILIRSRDIVWFWCIHFVMDMSQFDPVTFGAP